MKNLRLSDGPLELRRARMSEAPLLAAAVRGSLETLAPYLPWATADYNVEAARAFLEYSHEEASAGRGQHLSIFDSASGELLGGVAFMFKPLRETAELGYWVRGDRAGRGIATQASGLLMEDCLRREGLRRVYLTCDVKNLASRRVAEKLGMKREGRLREYILHDGLPRDHHLYAILARDFKPAFRS